MLVFSVLLCVILDLGVGLEYETVSTTFGPVKGVVAEKSKRFMGIPYGTAKRFEGPVDHPSWTEPQTVDRAGPMCYQHCPDTPANICQSQMSEDCLTLNIYVPKSTQEQSGFAVMVFIHGGNFDAYSGGSPLYDGDVFVNKGNVILVTLNYRLGAFGFLPRQSNGKLVSFNNGLQDQKLALKWIHDNIQSFGGDETKITLFGQSAGAQSVGIHLRDPDVQNYFHRVIIQSAPFTLPFRNITESEKQLRVFSAILNCSLTDSDCFKSKSADEILKAQQSTPRTKISDKYLMSFQLWGPVMDPSYIPSNLIEMLIDGSNRKDMIIGTTSGEGIGYVYSIFPTKVNPIMFPLLLSSFVRDSTNISKSFEVGNDAREAISEFVTEYIFHCPSKRISDIAANNANVWNYVFDQAMSFDPWGNGSQCNGRCCHGGELAFLFDTPYLSGYNVTSGDEELSSTMINYWANFAKYGDPNHGDNLPTWPKCSGSSGSDRRFMVLTEPAAHAKTYDESDRCPLLDQEGYHSLRR